jgi:3-deoxy-manno-octulosonate cytidylyltransferase (CMP-KDO synthetase)
MGDFVINVQGDEPFIALGLLEAMIFATQTSSADVFTGIYPVTSSAILMNPNRVKVVLDAHDRALYFSRHPIPFIRDIPDQEQWLNHHSFWGHVGIYGYRRKILSCYSSLKKGVLERVECLEQLRLLENGITIQCIRTPEPSIGIDTPEDLVEAEAFLQSHPEFDIEKY